MNRSLLILILTLLLGCKQEGEGQVMLSWPTDGRYETGFNVEKTTNAGQSWSMVSSNQSQNFYIVWPSNPQPASVLKTNDGLVYWQVDCAPYNQFRVSFNLGTTNSTTVMQLSYDGTNCFPDFQDYWNYAANFKVSITKL